MPSPTFLTQDDDSSHRKLRPILGGVTTSTTVRPTRLPGTLLTRSRA
jgi:hypothetical protein